jgi:hypothetical protein
MPLFGRHYHICLKGKLEKYSPNIPKCRCNLLTGVFNGYEYWKINNYAVLTVDELAIVCLKLGSIIFKVSVSLQVKDVITPCDMHVFLH